MVDTQTVGQITLSLKMIPNVGVTYWLLTVIFSDGAGPGKSLCGSLVCQCGDYVLQSQRTHPFLFSFPSLPVPWSDLPRHRAVGMEREGEFLAKIVYS